MSQSLTCTSPSSVKIQAIKSAGEAAGMLLKIDDVIAASKSKEGAGGPKGPQDSAKEEGEGE